ncbi:putative phage tail protein [Crossiella equi]|uniref:Phage tail protein n=1 Tax=Crossiella equi TaxID=130796 RepID=A0ABS5AJ81_9PSEU|nr:hypothetical protein [Crossiella equi]MBP2476628.1 putative phage tail protein [Crossiella equi]
MPLIDRSPRAELPAAVIGGIGAGIAFSGNLAVWWVSPTAAGEAVFGLFGSTLTVVVVVVALLSGVALTCLSVRLSRRWRMVAVVLLWLAAVLGGVFALASLFTGSAMSFVMLGGVALLVPITRAAHRALATTPTHDSRGGAVDE